MRIQAVLPLALAVLSACGGGEEKRAFDRYEAVVGPLLEEEEKSLSRFMELSADALHYGAGAEVGDFIRGRLIPLYARLDREVTAVKPGGEKLDEIHALLVRYIDLREDFLARFREMEALDKRGMQEASETRAKIEKNFGEVEKKGKAIEPSFRANPELARSLSESLRQIGAAAENYQKLVQGLDQGMVPSERYLSIVTEQLLPFFAQAKKGLAAMTPGAEGQKLLDAITAYVVSIEELIAAARPLVDVRAKIEAEGGPVQEQLRSLRQQADDTLRIYKEEARAYRDSLR